VPVAQTIERGNKEEKKMEQKRKERKEKVLAGC